MIIENLHFISGEETTFSPTRSDGIPDLTWFLSLDLEAAVSVIDSSVFVQCFLLPVSNMDCM